MILFFLGLSERQAAQEIFAVLVLFFHGEEGNGIDGLVSVVDHDSFISVPFSLHPAFQRPVHFRTFVQAVRFPHKAQKLPAGRVYQSDPLLAVFQMGFHDLFCSGVDPLYLAGMAERKLHLQDSA